MIDWNGIVAVFAAFFVVAASPGPATLAVSTVSASSGRKAGMQMGAGLGVGLSFWGLIAATGLGALLQTTTYVLIAVKVAGGLYLLWLAYGSMRSAIRNRDSVVPDAEVKGDKTQRWFLRGLLLNLSNPKAVFAWMAALSVGVGGNDGVFGVAAATFGCFVIGFLIYAVYAAAFSLSAIMAGYARLRRWIDAAAGVLFAVAGLSLLKSALGSGAKAA